MSSGGVAMVTTLLLCTVYDVPSLLIGDEGGDVRLFSLTPVGTDCECL